MGGMPMANRFSTISRMLMPLNGFSSSSVATSRGGSRLEARHDQQLDVLAVGDLGDVGLDVAVATGTDADAVARSVVTAGAAGSASATLMTSLYRIAALGGRRGSDDPPALGADAADVAGEVVAAGGAESWKAISKILAHSAYPQDLIRSDHRWESHNNARADDARARNARVETAECELPSSNEDEANEQDLHRDEKHLSTACTCCFDGIIKEFSFPRVR